MLVLGSVYYRVECQEESDDVAKAPGRMELQSLSEVRLDVVGRQRRFFLLHQRKTYSL